MDGIPCSADDPAPASPQSVFFNTDAALAGVANPDNAIADLSAELRARVEGARFDCAALAANPSGGVAGAKLVTALIDLDTDYLGADVVTTLELVAAPEATATPPGLFTPTPTAPTPTPSPVPSTTSPSAPPSSTATVTVTPHATPTPELSPTGPGPCTGDCDSNGTVTVDELVAAVHIALGRLPRAACPGFGADHNAAVTIDALVRAVHSALRGCPAEAFFTPRQSAHTFSRRLTTAPEGRV